MPNRRRTVVSAWKQASAHQAPLLAAGVAFYTFLALFPAMIAAILTYGLLVSPATVNRQSADLTRALPADAASIVTGQLDALTSTPSRSLGLGLVIAIVLAIYGASGGVGNLVTAINAMFGLKENRGFIKLKLLSLGLTVGAIVFLAVVIGLVAAAPAVFDVIDIVPGVRILLEVARWTLLVSAVVVAIGVLFRVAPNRTSDSGLVTKGVVVASILWVLVSVGFSLYVDNFGSYGKTYGALAGVVVLLLWLWIGLYAILLGASIEAVREKVVTPDTIEEDSEIAAWRTEAADGGTVPAEVVEEPDVEAEPSKEPEPARKAEPAPEPAVAKRSVFTRFRVPFRSRQDADRR
ncbi:YhjD/YihY/BrkB family envelope integrity protein [Aeromicrobium sp.]|uniref:YhjD/YihY/BrkB family envelope integrity protein n=1 Tax=Aeromicrobium sp. TaxID=1871063 RepID=UPI001993C95D|nr:YhjD/YihY/BrkB family envelope integrity protein [Aeromicrobium sp.]MBC7630482.1 YihY family inner membrane protein [Aeromicrobium sp.]